MRTQHDADKKSKEEVNYRKGNREYGRCKKCMFFERVGPRRCLQVQGRIDPEMTCDLFMR